MICCSYRIYRSDDGQDFKSIGTRPGRYQPGLSISSAWPGKSFTYRIRAIDVSNNESPPSEAVSATTRAFTDDELLDMVQQACFRYYWEAANASGMALEILPGDENLVALGARLWNHGDLRRRRARVHHARGERGADAEDRAFPRRPTAFTASGRIFSTATRAGERLLRQVRRRRRPGRNRLPRARAARGAAVLRRRQAAEREIRDTITGSGARSSGIGIASRPTAMCSTGIGRRTTPGTSAIRWWAGTRR